MKKRWQFLKALLLNKSLDLVIVIVGVTIAFQLNNLKQHSDQKSLERFYLESLVVDVNKDIKKMNEILVSLQADKSAAMSCLGGGKINKDTLAGAILEILSFETFNDRNENTYSTLIAGNGISVISNGELRNQIVEYYKSYRSIDRFESVYTAFLLNHFNTSFSPYFDFQNRQIINESILKNIQTKNNLMIANGQLDDGIESYEGALLKSTALKESLSHLLE
jgi:hypothetical protein